VAYAKISQVGRWWLGGTLLFSYWRCGAMIASLKLTRLVNAALLSVFGYSLIPSFDALFRPHSRAKSSGAIDLPRRVTQSGDFFGANWRHCTHDRAMGVAGY